VRPNSAASAQSGAQWRHVIALPGRSRFQVQLGLRFPVVVRWMAPRHAVRLLAGAGSQLPVAGPPLRARGIDLTALSFVLEGLPEHLRSWYFDECGSSKPSDGADSYD
jgi:hypothetical protein